MHIGTDTIPNMQKCGCPVQSAAFGIMKHVEDNGVIDDDGSFTCKEFVPRVAPVLVE